MLAIGSRGILISREIDPVTNQFVWTTALDAHGLSAQVVNALEINGSQIKGDIISSYDNSTWIDLNTGEFNFKDKIKFINDEFSITLNNGETIDDFVSQYEKDKESMTNDINDVAQEVENIRDNIDIVISDGVITEAEIVSIEKSIMQLQKEKVDIDTRYLSMINNSYLDSELKLKLTSSYNSYIKAHSDFVSFIQNMIEDREITEKERADLDTYSSNYNTALATLKTDMDTCLSNIAENNTSYQIENLKTKIDSDFQDVNDRLDAIVDDVGGVIADGIIEEAEVLIIQNSIKQLNKEKEDVDMIYDTLYNDSDVPTENKEDLKTKHDEYNTAHYELITFINVMISDKVATEEEKTTFDNLTDTYSTKLALFKNSANIALAMSSKNYTNTQFNVLNDKIEMRVTSQEVQEIVNVGIEESKSYSDALFEGFQDQIDGIIETYYQSTDPSIDWTTNELKTQHIGDIWYDNLNNVTYRWNGTTWEKLTDAEAEQAYALASSKAKVFTSTPTTPYKVGDLWVQGSNGDIMKCIYARSSGNYVSSDWAKASKYTDDTVANEVKDDLANNYYTIKQTDSAIEIAKDSITSSVSENYVTKDSFDDTTSTLATKSELTQTSTDLTAKFTSSSGGNILLNSRPRNNTTYWAVTQSSGTTNTSNICSGNENWNGEIFKSGIWWSGTAVDSGSSNWCCLWNDSLSNYKFNTTKSYSVSLIIYSGSSDSKSVRVRICNRNSSYTVASNDFTIVNGYQYISYEFTPSLSGDSPRLGFYLDTLGSFEFYIPWVVVKEGSITKAWISNGDEIEEGMTTINKDGITITNGGLTIKDNSGNKVLYGDADGNLYLTGYLQGIDQQVKLIGDTMKIDGRNGALRFQFDPKNYLYVNESACVFYSTNSYAQTATGYYAPRIQVNTSGHAIFGGAMGMVKILNNSTYPDVQARNSTDGAYVRMCASSFEVNSKKKFKENIKDVDTNTIINILKSNDVKSYNLISERESLDLLELEAQEKGIELEYEMITPDEKIGLVIEDLTDDAKDLLFASNSDGIDLYNMTSMLWNVCQEQQKTIEKQEQKISSLEERLSKLEEILGGENK